MAAILRRYSWKRVAIFSADFPPYNAARKELTKNLERENFTVVLNLPFEKETNYDSFFEKLQENARGSVYFFEKFVLLGFFPLHKKLSFFTDFFSKYDKIASFLRFGHIL